VEKVLMLQEVVCIRDLREIPAEKQMNFITSSELSLSITTVMGPSCGTERETEYAIWNIK
jgi:hypothetical protein